MTNPKCKILEKNLSPAFYKFCLAQDNFPKYQVIKGLKYFALQGFKSFSITKHLKIHDNKILYCFFDRNTFSICFDTL